MTTKNKKSIAPVRPDYDLLSRCLHIPNKNEINHLLRGARLLEDVLLFWGKRSWEKEERAFMAEILVFDAVLRRGEGEETKEIPTIFGYYVHAEWRVWHCNRLEDVAKILDNIRLEWHYKRWKDKQLNLRRQKKLNRQKSLA